jgi:hypothetical protein
LIFRLRAPNFKSHRDHTPQRLPLRWHKWSAAAAGSLLRRVDSEPSAAGPAAAQAVVKLHRLGGGGSGRDRAVTGRIQAAPVALRPHNPPRPIGGHGHSLSPRLSSRLTRSPGAGRPTRTRTPDSAWQARSRCQLLRLATGVTCDAELGAQGHPAGGGRD